jgi:hypothetical protein
MLVAGAGEEIRPGMVAVVQTFGERVNFHPHVHALRDRKKHFAFDSTACEIPSLSHLFACSPAILG